MLENKFFIAGSDYFSVTQKGDAVIRSFSDFDIEIIDGNAVKITEVLQELQRVYDALRTISMFSPQKFVWYKNVTFLGDDAAVKSEDVQAWILSIQQALKQLPEVGFLLTTMTIDRRLKIVKWFLENCQSAIFDEPQKSGCEQYILSRIRSAGKKINPDALNQLLQYTGDDLGIVDGELDKVLLYVHEKNEINCEDIEAIAIDLRGDNFFETVDLFFLDSKEQFLSNIRRYFLYRDEGRPFLAALQNRTRLLIQLRYFYENDGVQKISKSILEQLKKQYATIYQTGSGGIFAQNPWYLGKLLAIAKKCSLQNWIQLQIVLLRAVIDLSEKYNHQQVIFERLYFYRRSLSSAQETEL
ncbi:MAG: DNA polymerase III subunit delta [Puniceicoccales bacterium]|jgi:DNA polymerase-3 subunit delta|nr:DNA polymerase III subunit delta [Puniceicoccales bacterium]